MCLSVYQHVRGVCRVVVMKCKRVIGAMAFGIRRAGLFLVILLWCVKMIVN